MRDRRIRALSEVEGLFQYGAIGRAISYRRSAIGGQLSAVSPLAPISKSVCCEAEEYTKSMLQMYAIREVHILNSIFYLYSDFNSNMVRLREELKRAHWVFNFYFNSNMVRLVEQLAIGGQLSAVSYQRSAIGGQLSAVSYQHYSII